MIGENRQSITNEPVEFEKWPVEVQDCRKITDHFWGIYRIYPNLIRENRRMLTCNRLDLQTLGSQVLNWLLCPKISQSLNRLTLVHQDYCKKITTDRFRGIYRIYYPNLIKEHHRRMWTCDQPVGLANTRISTGYHAQECPRSLPKNPAPFSSYTKYDT